MNPTRPETVRAVAAAISRAEIHDDRMTSDPNRIKAWADTCETHGIDDTSLACRAVDQYYTQSTADTIRVGAFIASYRKVRALDGEEAKAVELQNLPELTPPDPQFGGLPLRTEGRPVWAAYEHFDAITRQCPTCGAQPEESCVNRVNNQTRRIPCLRRMKPKAAA